LRLAETVFGDVPSLLQRIPCELKPVVALSIGAVQERPPALAHGSAPSDRRIALIRLVGLPDADIAYAGDHFRAFALTQLGLISRAYDAIYFCANAYTTLGYGLVDLGQQWRNISPIIAISGLFTFAWSTSALVDVVVAHSRLIEQLEHERDKAILMRKVAREEKRVVQVKSRQAELAERQKAREQAAGASFFERRKIWKAERKKEDEFRREARAEIESIAREERLAEEKLGASTLSGDDGKRGRTQADGKNE
jgi:hypothetical protein